MSGLIDSHCHLTYPELAAQIDAVMDRARHAGVSEMVTIATDLSDAERAFALAMKYPNVRVVCGIHPHGAGKAASGWDEQLTVLAARQDVFGVGEMGLDYHYEFADRASQEQVFQRQLEIASVAGKSVVIHCREAHGVVMGILAEFPKLAGVVFHCFTGSLTEAQEILDRGYWISLTGVVTFKRSDELREVARMIPEDRLMLETDSPYLSPEPVRNVRPNEPAHVVHTAACIAKARGMTEDVLARVTTANARRFFNLPGAA